MPSSAATPELTEPTLLVAGWVNVSLTPRPTGFDPSVPDPFLTISDCLAADLVTPEFSGWFQSLDEAASARVGTARVIGIGLADAMVATFVEGVADDRHFDKLRAREVISYPTLGFQIVGAEACLFFHSWHCHGYAAEVRDILGIELNDLGLIATCTEAQRVLVALPSSTCWSGTPRRRRPQSRTPCPRSAPCLRPLQ